MAAFSTWHCITDELTMHSVLFGTSLSLALSLPR
jgi:dihydroceramidase